MKKKRRKIKKREGGKLKMEGGKVTRWGEDLFFFLLVTFQNHWNLFWVYQNGHFLSGKNISHWEKSFQFIQKHKTKPNFWPLPDSASFCHNASHICVSQQKGTVVSWMHYKILYSLYKDSCPLIGWVAFIILNIYRIR